MVLGTERSSHQRCSLKKAALKIFHYSQENSVLASLFNKAAGLQACNFIKKRLQACNFIKKRLQHRCFSVNIVKCLRIPISKNICFCTDKTDGTLAGFSSYNSTENKVTQFFFLHLLEFLSSIQN